MNVTPPCYTIYEYQGGEHPWQTTTAITQTNY